MSNAELVGPFTQSQQRKSSHHAVCICVIPYRVYCVSIDKLLRYPFRYNLNPPSRVHI